MSLQLSRWGPIVCVALLSLGIACGKEDRSDAVEAQLTDSIEKAQFGGAPDPVTALDFTAAQQLADSVDRMLRRVRGLTWKEQRNLRRDVNAIQIARAQELGIQPQSDVNSLVTSHALVQLPNDTRYWTLYHLDFSVPFVTPSTATLLAEIGERFQSELDSLQVPRFRLVITSALRTPDNQTLLRRRNSNASKIESAHEFGTTVDIAYRRFAPPLGETATETRANATSYIHTVADSIIAHTAGQRAGELQAILGRVLQQMSNEGKVMVMMERRQTVYHITVARRL